MRGLFFVRANGPPGQCTQLSQSCAEFDLFPYKQIITVYRTCFRGSRTRHRLAQKGYKLCGVRSGSCEEVPSSCTIREFIGWTQILMREIIFAQTRSRYPGLYPLHELTVTLFPFHKRKSRKHVAVFSVCDTSVAREGPSRCQRREERVPGNPAQGMFTVGSSGSCFQLIKIEAIA